MATTITQKQAESAIRQLQQQGATQQQIQEYLNTVTVKKEKVGRVKETIQDIAQTGRELGDIFQETRQAAREQFERGATGEVAAPRAGLRMVGEIAGGLGRAAGSLFTGAGRLLFGQKTEEAIGRGVGRAAQAVMESAPGQFVAREAETLQRIAPELSKDIRAAGQIGAAVTDITGFGLAPRGARAGLTAAERLARTTPARAAIGRAEGAITGAREFAGDVAQSVFQRGALSEERAARAIQGAVKDYADNVFTTTSNRRRIANANQNLARYDTDVLTEMARRGITPDIEDGKARFNSGIERLDAEIGTIADELDFELQRYSRVRDGIDDLKQDVETLIRQNPALANTGRVNKVIQEAKSRLDDIAADKGRDYLTVPEMNEFKRALYKESKVYKKVNPDFNKADGAYELGQVLRQRIEDLVDDVDVRALNTELAKTIELQHFLDRVGTPAVRGGRLGTMAGQAVGAVIGTSANLPIVGPIIGATAGRVAAKLFQKTSLSPLRSYYLKKIARGYDDEINRRALDVIERLQSGEMFDIPQAELRQIQNDLRKRPFLLGPAKEGAPRQQTIGTQPIEIGERGTSPRGLGNEAPAQRIVNPSATTKTMDLLEEAPITSLNPTGGVFVDYTPQQRATAPLGQNMTTLAETMGKSPDETITIYRGAPKSQTEIVAGDFVTTNRQLAQTYGENVLEKKVRLGDVLDDIEEPGLGEESLYRPGADKEVAKVNYDYRKSEWYNNYLNFLKENPTKYPTLESWLDGMRASGKTRSQLEDIWKQANSKN